VDRRPPAPAAARHHPDRPALESRQDLGRSWKPWLRGTALGFPFGAIPAGGAEIPTFLSYVTEKRLTRHPEEFGNGAIEGVAGPEASNNASAAGSLVTMLALGLLTSATAAVLLAAFQGFGIQTGPLLLEREADLVWALIASLFIGNTLLLVLNLPLAPIWAKLLKTPRPYLYAGTLFFALRRGRPATAGPAAAEVPAAAPPAGAEDRPLVPADGPPSGGAEAPGPGARPDRDQEGP
jgi:putative tricarboxylic transport membrane protein